MVQKVTEIVGVSPESFAGAAKDAVKQAGKTVRGMKWARVSELEMELDGSKIKSYRATVRLYFDVER
ncbi:MAG TPA: dodecin family protein [Thermoplasmata archaeon]|nr:dodecin family protein [Thermoplasmata archaeon]